jgi:hypothetical protein
MMSTLNNITLEPPELLDAAEAHKNALSTYNTHIRSLCEKMLGYTYDSDEMHEHFMPALTSYLDGLRVGEYSYDNWEAIGVAIEHLVSDTNSQIDIRMMIDEAVFNVMNVASTKKELDAQIHIYLANK